jgi:uncharacterized protein YbjT (DUF2867 family)
MSTAIVIGATGMVGTCLVRQLLADPAYSRVIALTRRATSRQAERYAEQVIDFDHPERFAELVRGDVLFSAMGTTRGQAGSLVAQRRVDYTYQLEVARLAAHNGVKRYVLVSSTGANPRSFNPYLKMKGELERDVQALGFGSLQILQPGPLTGEREKPRTGEAMAESILGVLNAVGLFRSMRPISGERVAQAMRHAATLMGTRTYTAAELFTLG